MIIIRQKEFARSDYKGLSKFPEQQLKWERNKIARKLKKKRNAINNEYNTPPLKKNAWRKMFYPDSYWTDTPYKNIKHRNKLYDKALDWAKKESDNAKYDARTSQLNLRYPTIIDPDDPNKLKKEQKIKTYWRNLNSDSTKKILLDN